MKTLLIIVTLLLMVGCTSPEGSLMSQRVHLLRELRTKNVRTDAQVEQLKIIQYEIRIIDSTLEYMGVLK